MKIVVGTDGSPDAQRGVEWAADHARNVGAEIVAVYSIEMIYPAAPMAVPVLADVDESRRSEAEIALEEACAPLREAGVPYRAVIDDGNAAAAIERVADEEAADLLVVGRRGRGALGSLLLGSVTNQLLHHTTHTVVVVPPAKKRTADD